VCLVSLEPALGAEIRKTRPALILQNDIANRFSPLTIVAAISSRFEERLYPTEVLVEPPEGGLTKPAVVLLNQIRSIDKRRLLRRTGRLKPESMRRVDRALRVSLGITKM
jgi:mRNA interferase MazF